MRAGHILRAGPQLQETLEYPARCTDIGLNFNSSKIHCFFSITDPSFRHHLVELDSTSLDLRSCQPGELAFELDGPRPCTRYRIMALPRINSNSSWNICIVEFYYCRHRPHMLMRVTGTLRFVEWSGLGLIPWFATDVAGGLGFGFHF